MPSGEQLVRQLRRQRRARILWNLTQPPKEPVMKTEYCIAYTDDTPDMSGSKISRQVQTFDRSRAEMALLLLKKRHPDARVESRQVTEWQVDT